MPVEDTQQNVLAAAIPHEHVIFTDLDGLEGVLVDLNTKKYYQLNETASLVWRGIERHLSVEKIATELAASYEISPDRAVSSVETLLRALHAQKLVQRD
ncbi:MAG: PqqD family protein [Acidobacteriota bacterium]